MDSVTVEQGVHLPVASTLILYCILNKLLVSAKAVIFYWLFARVLTSKTKTKSLQPTLEQSVDTVAD